jgi:single-strand DNA-binding protein
MSLPTITLTGHVGRDVEVRVTASGQSVASFSVAVNQSRRDESAESGWTDETAWYRVSAWGQLATRLGGTLRKGHRVVVAGSLRQREWQDQDGATRLSLDVNASSVTDLGRRPAEAANGASVADAVPAVDAAAADLPF